MAMFAGGVRVGLNVAVGTHTIAIIGSNFTIHDLQIYICELL